MYGGLDIAVSGMVAQRTRLNAIASNIANKDAILDANGEPNPFQRRITVFEAGNPGAMSRDGQAMGVHVAEIALDDSEFRKVWDPDNPYARQEGEVDAGYVYYPNVDTVTEQVNAMEAVRAYEANVRAAEATKTILAQALRLIA